MGRWEIRSKSKSRRLDETFLAGSIDGEQEGSLIGARAPVLQLYMQPKSRPGTAGSTSGTGSAIGGAQASSSSATLVDTSSASLVLSGSSTTNYNGQDESLKVGRLKFASERVYQPIEIFWFAPLAEVSTITVISTQFPFDTFSITSTTPIGTR